MSGNINIVIGSWGSYNECNERALGSKWLDLSDYSEWDEIVEELKNEGFELDGIDEELFIQDVEGIEDRSVMRYKPMMNRSAKFINNFFQSGFILFTSAVNDNNFSVFGNENVPHCLRFCGEKLKQYAAVK